MNSSLLSTLGGQVWSVWVYSFGENNDGYLVCNLILKNSFGLNWLVIQFEENSNARLWKKSNREIIRGSNFPHSTRTRITWSWWREIETNR
jgi:hypothetical protein